MAEKQNLRKGGFVITYCAKQRQQQFICFELFFFVVKSGIPTNEELEKLSLDIASDWKKLGRRLGINDPLIQEIDKANDHLSEKGYDMLKRWQQKEGTAANYQALSYALQNELVQRQDLAEKFCYT